jgi:hypothetical protein
MTDPHPTNAALEACWLCAQHSTKIETHVLDHDHYEISDCAAASGVTVGLCPMCHTAVHNWMRSHGAPNRNAAAEGLNAVLDRFTSALLA